MSSSNSDHDRSSESSGELWNDLLEEFCQCWHNGRPVSVEQFVLQKSLDQLTRDAWLDLIAQEFVLREESGQAVALEEYTQRFPQFAAELKVQWTLHQQLAQEAARPGDVATEQADPDQAPDDGATRADDTLIAVRPAESGGLQQRIGPYRVLRKIGQGGMGSVFEAEDELLHRRVAIKVIHEAALGDPVAQARFLQEARSAAAVQHDHIVTIYQVGQDQNRLFMAMPLLRGETLADRLKHPADLPLASQLRILQETATALAAAHQAGLIHRDIKPANIWLESPRDRVKILDFGLARPVTVEQHLTESGVILGTLAYLSPEQADSRPVTPRSDLFSLGCVAYQMLTGRSPFLRGTLLATLGALAHETPSAPHDVSPNVPPRVSRLVMRMLARDPQQRPTSATEVAEALADLEAELSHRPDTPDVKPTPSRPAVLVGGLALISLACVWWLWGPKPGPTPAEESLAARSISSVADSTSTDDSGRVNGTGPVPSPVSAALIPGGENVSAAVTPTASPAMPIPVPVPVVDAHRTAAVWALAAGGRIEIRPLNSQGVPSSEITALNGDQLQAILPDAAEANAEAREVIEAIAAGAPAAWARAAARVLPSTPFVLRVIMLYHPVARNAVSQRGMVFQDRIFDTFSRLNSLEVLALEECVGMTDAGVVKLVEMPKLQAIHLGGLKNGLTDRSVLALSRISSLAEVMLPDSRFSEAGWQSLGQLPGLKYLNASNTNITDHVAANIIRERASSLMHIQLIDVPVGEETIRAIGEHGRFRFLGLDRCSASEDALVGLANNHSLLELRFQSTVRDSVTDRTAAALSQLSQLRMLQLQNFQWSPSAWESLTQLSRMKTLRILETSLDEASLASVMRLPHLQEFVYKTGKPFPDSFPQLLAQAAELKIVELHAPPGQLPLVRRAKLLNPAMQISLGLEPVEASDPELVRPSTDSGWQRIQLRDYRQNPDQILGVDGGTWGFRNGSRFAVQDKPSAPNSSVNYAVLDVPRVHRHIVAAIRIRARDLSYGLRFRDIRPKPGVAERHLGFWIASDGTYFLTGYDKAKGRMADLAQGKLRRAPDSFATWHTLKVEAEQDVIRIFFDEERIIEVRDPLEPDIPPDRISMIAFHYRSANDQTPGEFEVAWEQAWALDAPAPAAATSK